MFTPESSVRAAASTARRNPRRRQRTDSDGSGATSQPKPKRQRAGLRNDTFEKPTATAANGDKEAGSVPNGSAHREQRATSSETRELPVRATKKGGERSGSAARGDESLTLTRNNRYEVTKLPALPDRLRNNKNGKQKPSGDDLNDVLNGGTENFHGSLYSDAGYALALTHSHAVVWPYRDSTSSPETFSFVLPYPSKNSSDPLPIGSLVHASASSTDPGLVVVMPNSGKITYWESISSAAALDMIRQQRHGIEGSVGGLLSGETVVQIEDVDPAGFVLRFSTGRIALLSTRDAQGRPAISVQPLRNRGATGGGGLFGSIKTVFGGGAWRRDVAVVRAGTSSKRAERDFVVATESGFFQIWNVHRGGHYDLLGEVNGRQEMISVIKRTDPKLSIKTEEDFHLLDLAFISHIESGNDDDSTPEAVKLLVLIAVPNDASTSYVLLEVIITGDELAVTRVNPIHCYSVKTNPKSPSQPRIFLPQPAHTAFVVFERAVVVATIAKRPSSPDQQLLMDTHELPQPFEDVVDFRDGIDIQITGCADEEGKSNKRRGKDPACALLVRGGGVIRIVAFQPNLSPTFDGPEGVTAKSKIEQAIYFGTEAQNPLNFSGRPEITFSLNEVEQAALEVSSEILDSSSPYLPTAVPSQEQNLKRRASLLQDLASHLKKTYPPLSRVTKWMLLFDAEKMAASRAIWKRYDAEFKNKQPDKETTLLADLVVMMSDKFKTLPKEEIGEVDAVRHWFTHDIGQLQALVPWAQNTMAENYKQGIKDTPTVFRMTGEANAITLSAVETAHQFRQDNAAQYGLEDEHLVDGVLRDNYEGLPEFWTSTAEMLKASKALVDLSRELAIKLIGGLAEELDIPDRLVRKMAEENVRQVDMVCLTYTERSLWCLAQDDEKLRHEGTREWAAYVAVRTVQISRLGDLEMAEEGITLAEKYEDMQTLVHLVGNEITDVATRLTEAGIEEDEEQELQERLLLFTERYETYFERFGDQWARAIYQEQIKHGRFSDLLDNNEEQQRFLTRFLRNNPEYSKLSWINDISGEKDFATASTTLFSQAHLRETNVWSKKVQLSIGKLAHLAIEGAPTHHVTRLDERKEKFVSGELKLIDTQEKLYELVYPEVVTAIDESAAVELAMERFGSLVSKDQPALAQVLRSGLGALIAREALGASRLVDVLTLMNRHYSLDDPSELSGQEFYLALEALEISGPKDKAQKRILERMIWRRCMIRDDWVVINDTQLKDDKAVEQSTGDTALFTTLKAGYKTGFWDEKSPLRPTQPSTVLGAGCTARDLQSMFPEDMCEAIAKDLSTEDDQLSVYIEKGRLDEWYTGIVEAAKNSVLDDAERDAYAVKRKEELASLLRQRRLGAGQGGIGLTNGHVAEGEDGEDDEVEIREEDEVEDDDEREEVVDDEAEVGRGGEGEVDEEGDVVMS
ncbi:MAG: hypothetical protein M4579_006012 [Chaenotheca gracillima]|nr:MAG: hypothetical protein M4579_006012 [Chaenotheca gracillima]